jgi:hypothetical protein
LLIIGKNNMWVGAEEAVSKLRLGWPAALNLDLVLDLDVVLDQSFLLQDSSLGNASFKEVHDHV